MPDISNNIYIEYNVDGTDDGKTDAFVNYVLVDDDNIGGANIPTVYRSETKNDTVFDMSVYYTAVDSINVVSAETYVDFDVDFVDSVYDYIDVGFYAGDISYLFVPTYILYVTGYSAVGYSHLGAFYTAGKMYSTIESTNVNYFLFEPYFGYSDVYSTFISQITTSGMYNTDVDVFECKLTDSGVYSANINVSFAGWPIYNYNFDFICSNQSVFYNNFDIFTISGTSVDDDANILFDVYSCFSSSIYNDVDVYNCAVGFYSANCSFLLGNGAFIRTKSDIYSCFENNAYINTEFFVNSMYVSNFSIGVDEYSDISMPLSFDIKDDIYSVDVSSINIKINDENVSFSYSSIADGYSIAINDLSAYENDTGVYNLYIYFENDVGSYIYREFTFLSGVELLFDNYNYIDYGYKNRVDVLLSSENKSSCPSGLYDSYYFITKDRRICDLYSSITGYKDRYFLSNSSEVVSTIDTIDLAFIHGKHFTVEIDAEDYNGNAMETFVFEFIID